MSRQDTSGAALSSQVAIVSGGSRNMGRHICLALARAGADIGILDLPVRRPDAQAVCAEVTALGQRAAFVPLDIRDAAAIPAAVAAVARQLGSPTVLVNNAGKTDDQPAAFLDYPAAALDEHYEVVLRGTFMLSQAVARQMVAAQTRGSIIHIASRAGVQAQPNAPAYGAVKASVAHLRRIMALELAQHRIRVNVVAPGPVLPDVPRRLGERTSASLGDATGIPGYRPFPLGRLLTYDDIASAVVFLASPASAMVTGQTLVIDGGLGLFGP